MMKKQTKITLFTIAMIGLSWVFAYLGSESNTAMFYWYVIASIGSGLSSLLGLVLKILDL